MMKSMLTFQGVVYPRQCDHMGHLNVKYYAEIFDQAVWVLFTKIGLTTEYFRENGRGMAAIEYSGKYYREIIAGNTVYVQSQIIEIQQKTIRIRHELFLHQEANPAADQNILATHLNTDLRKSTALPTWISQSFSSLEDSDID